MNREVQRPYLLLLLVSSCHPGPASAGEQSTGRGSICPFGKVHLSLSRLGLVYSSQLFHKEDTAQPAKEEKWISI